MNLFHAEALALKLFSRFGLEGWRVTFEDPLHGWLGTCRSGGREILLNARHVSEADDADVLATILHEVAHALAGRDVPTHGREWRRRLQEAVDAVAGFDETRMAPRMGRGGVSEDSRVVCDEEVES